MAQYLLQLTYTPAAMAAMVANPQDRAKAVASAVKKLGGKVDQFWWSFGDHDIVGILTMPDNVSAAAFAFAVGAGGACTNIQTTPLMSIPEAMEAMSKAQTCGYKPATAK